MKLNESARNLIGKGADATLITLNPDGSPHLSLVWVALQSTPERRRTRRWTPLQERKQEGAQRPPRSPRRHHDRVPRGPGPPISLWLSVNGTARIVEGGAPELLKDLAAGACPRRGIRAGGCTSRDF